MGVALCWRAAGSRRNRRRMAHPGPGQSLRRSRQGRRRLAISESRAHRPRGDRQTQRPIVRSRSRARRRRGHTGWPLPRPPRRPRHRMARRRRHPVPKERPRPGRGRAQPHPRRPRQPDLARRGATRRRRPDRTHLDAGLQGPPRRTGAHPRGAGDLRPDSAPDRSTQPNLHRRLRETGMRAGWMTETRTTSSRWSLCLIFWRRPWGNRCGSLRSSSLNHNRHPPPVRPRRHT